MEAPAPNGPNNDPSSDLLGSGSKPFGKSISDTPYRFNLDCRPDDSTLLRQHKAYFKSTLHFDLAQKSKMWGNNPDLWVIEDTFRPVLSQIALTAKHFTVELFTVGTFHRTYLITTCHESCSSNHLFHTSNASAMNNVSQMPQTPIEGAAAKLQLLLRLILPVFPWCKTESEVATMEYLRTQTTIPIPRIYAFDSSAINPIGLEWILMEKPTGRPYDKVAGTLKGRHKKSFAKSFTKSMASHTNALSKLHFSKIGSLYCDWEATKPAFFIGPAVDMELLLASHCLYPVEGAVFPSLKAYLMAFLELKMQHIRASDATQHPAQAAIVAPSERNTEAGGEVEAAAAVEESTTPTTAAATPDGPSRIVRACQRFQRLVSASALLEQAPIPTNLHRHGLVESEVLVDARGSVTAILDWDCVVAAPKCLGDNTTGAARGGLRSVGAGSPGLTDSGMDRVLEAKDVVGKKKKQQQQGVAVGVVIKTLAAYMFAVEEDVSGAERWLAKLEKCDVLK